MNLYFHYCPLCGGPLTTTDRQGRKVPACPRCNFVQSQEVGVAGVIAQAGKVLLEQRNVPPGEGLWGLPGGIVETGETLDAALERELREETGLAITVGPLILARGGRTVTTLIFEAEVLGGTLTKSEESLQVVWVPLPEIPWTAIAFPSHRDALREWVARRAP